MVKTSYINKLWASLNDTEDRLESQKNIIQSFFDSMTNP